MLNLKFTLIYYIQDIMYNFYNLNGLNNLIFDFDKKNLNLHCHRLLLVFVAAE